MDADNAYDALDDGGDARWAFGTAFDQPLAGLDASVPAGVDGADLAAYHLMLGDDALVMSHRLQQWCTHAPELEEEVALANIALDLLGQARLLLARAGAADGSGRDEDHYAFWRDAADYRNVRLVEMANGDFAHSMARLLVFSVWRLATLEDLRRSRDPVLAAVAAKGAKEVAYHRDYAAAWVVRLGDGTTRSHARMQAALDAVWPWCDELYVTHPVERRLVEAGVAVDPVTLRAGCDEVLRTVIDAAGLTIPDPVAPDPVTPGAVTGEPGGRGRNGGHTPALDDLLAELQSVAREHPGVTW